MDLRVPGKERHEGIKDTLGRAQIFFKRLDLALSIINYSVTRINYDYDDYYLI